jgi:hypothetical protein
MLRAVMLGSAAFVERSQHHVTVNLRGDAV